jgi:pSer/pThr/pTyr-binding forkhead associated (FHA) protein
MHGSSSADRSGTPAKKNKLQGTRLESVKEIRKAIRARRTPPAGELSGDADTAPFRPSRRPQTALLCIVDDGRSDGEWLRLRGETYVIGRTEGEIRIPHDTMISGRHAELSRRVENGSYRWYLTDLESTNGTYVRVSDAILKHNQELLIGSRRYRFEAQGPYVAQSEEPTPARLGQTGTSAWPEIPSGKVGAFLVELTLKGEGERFQLKEEENWIGRRAGRCNILITDDRLVSPRHARIYQDSKTRWHVENGKTLNGTWLRIDTMALDSACQFQLGEQRFNLKVL